MATKKECDRCKKQWVPEKLDGYEERNVELCTISFLIPYGKDTPPTPAAPHWTKRPHINETREFCQDCARHIWEAAQPTPIAKENDYDKGNSI